MRTPSLAVARRRSPPKLTDEESFAARVALSTQIDRYEEHAAACWRDGMNFQRWLEDMRVSYSALKKLREIRFG